MGGKINLKAIGQIGNVFASLSNGTARGSLLHASDYVLSLLYAM